MKLLRFVALIGLVSACKDSVGSAAPEATQFEITSSFTLDSIDRVRDLRVGREGQVWVLSSSPPFLSVFDSGGTLVRAGGRSGRGPTDFLYPFRIVGPRSNHSSAIEILDLGRHQLVQVDSLLLPFHARDLRLIQGTMRADIPALLASLPFSVAVSGDTALAVRVKGSISTEIDLAAQELVQLHGSNLRPIVSFPRQTAGAYRWLRTNALWSACEGAGLIGVDPTHQHLLRVLPSGQVDSMPVQVSRQRTELSKADVKRNLLHHIELEYSVDGEHRTSSYIDSAANRVLRSIATGRTDSLPRFAAVMCADSGAAWLQAFDLSDSPVGAGRYWWRQTPSGWGKVVLPSGFHPFQVVGERVLGVATDSTGLEFVAYASPRR